MANKKISQIGSGPLTSLANDMVIETENASGVSGHTTLGTLKDFLTVGLMELKGDTDCSANPNYPTALKGDAYIVTVAGKIGGASGKAVDVGDAYIASSDNAGGDEAGVGSSWFVLEHNFSAATPAEQLSGTEAAKASTPDSVAALWEKGSDVASAGTISLGEGGYFNITGTTTITDFDFATDKAGRKAWVKFAGALTLTHNASTLILPTGASIVTAAGDTACFVSEDTDIVRCVAYQRASGAALVGGGGGYEVGSPSVPLVSSFTWVNQGTSTASDGTNAILITPQLDGNVRGIVKSTPSAPFSVYCRMHTSYFSTASNTSSVQCLSGILLRNSGGLNRQLLVGVERQRVAGDEQNIFTVSIIQLNSTGGFVARAFAETFTAIDFNWIKADVTSTTVTMSVSVDGENWRVCGSESISTHIVAVDQYGIGASGLANNTGQTSFIRYFDTVAP